MTREIVVASRNKGKIREIQQILSDLPARIVTVPDLPDVTEDGATFAENARKKALETARHVKTWALADDSGLEVDALNGAPGIRSARWSEGGDEANNDKLLAELKDVPPPARTARYRAAIVVATPEGEVVAEADGSCEGVIGFERRGAGGFGYDPLFVLPEFGCTMAELPAGTKNRISHRGQALASLKERLTRFLDPVR